MSFNDLNYKSQYEDKIILAPMVRIGALPMRLLALQYGADLVFSEELIDYKLIRCKLFVNDSLGTYDLIEGNNKLVFRTCDQEKSKLIFQIGTNNGERALTAAKIIEPYVSGIDINMGCPKPFSVKGGMGAALLTNSLKIKEILTHLISNLTIPVTCKIRILPSIEETLKLAQLIESTGVAAITVHGRNKDERPEHPNHDDYIREISRILTIPVIANGGSSDISHFYDIEAFKKKTEASSVMIGRAAQSNCSIFRKEGLLEINEVIRDYLKFAIKYDNNLSNTKYCIQHFLGSLQKKEKGKKTNSAQSLRELSSIWEMSDYYDLCFNIS